MKTWIPVLAGGLLSAFAVTAAPPLCEPTVTSWQQLGTWDDACVLDDRDLMVVRRGDAFSMLAVTNAFVASPRARSSAARDSSIVGAAYHDGRLWGFLQRPKDDPCAVDLTNGSVVEFVLIVCHCHRQDDAVIRIISARKADKRESKDYQR